MAEKACHGFGSTTQVGLTQALGHMQTSWVQTIKLFFLQLTGLSRDALHVYAGMLVFLVGAVLLRKRLHSPMPWLLVLVAACGMEALDARDDMQLFGYWRISASLHDIVNTALWPTIIFLICRYTGLARKP